MNFDNKNILDVKNIIREVVFGLEDGMVSTLGAVTGIAVGSGDRFTVLLAGIVIISVESISMGIGSFISNMSSKEVEEKVVDDEKESIKMFPEEQRRDLYRMFIRDGWTKRMAQKMAKFAILDRKLLIKENEYRKLGIFPYQKSNPLKNAIFMFISYIIGGIFPLISFFLLPVSKSVYTSVILTLSGLFILGVTTTLYTNTKPVKAGIRLLIMGGTAFFIGLIVGEIANLIK